MASAGNRVALIRATRPKFKRVSALGVRVERDDTVLRREIETALGDIGIPVPLLGARLAAAEVEALLERVAYLNAEGTIGIGERTYFTDFQKDIGLGPISRKKPVTLK